MKYRIGEVSKILDIPVETIRFYESKGLIHPQKDKNNNYRYYDIRDIERLMDYKRLRDLEFSLPESVEIIESASLEGFADKLQEKIDEAEKKVEFYRLKSLKLQNYRNILMNIPISQEYYAIVNRPEGYYFINRWYKDGQKIKYTTAKENEELFENLLSHYTFVENIYRIRKEWFDSGKTEEEYEWGFTIKKRWADALHLKIDERMDYIPPIQSIYMFLKATEDDYFSPRMLKGVFDFMERRNLKLAGDIFGNHIASVRENGQNVRYMEVWIPIRSD